MIVSCYFQPFNSIYLTNLQFVYKYFGIYQMLSFSCQETILNEILKRKSNYNCADCTTISPTWASLDFGVFLCSNCSGAHRSLGPTVTRVRSTKLDKWQAEWVDLMQVGNIELNSYWEAQFCPDSLKLKKPSSISSPDEVKRFVVQKYIKKKFIPKGVEKIDPKTYFLKQQKQCKKEEVINKKEVEQPMKPHFNQKTSTSLLDCDINVSQKFSNNAKCEKVIKDVTGQVNSVQISSISIDDDEDFGHFTDGGVVEQEQSFNGNSNVTHSTTVSGSAATENTQLSFEELMNINKQKEEDKRRQMHQMHVGMFNQHIYQHQNINMNGHIHFQQSPYDKLHSANGHHNINVAFQQFMPQHNPLQNYNYIQPHLQKAQSMGIPSHSNLISQDGWSNWQ